MKKSICQLTKLMALVAIGLNFGCVPERCPEEPPSLTFHQYDYKAADPADPFASDSLTIITQFVDCQGDAGVEGDEKNLKTFLFEKINGDWVKFIPADSADTVLLFVQIPKSSKVQEDQKAEGFIFQPMGSIKQSSDTIRFETRLTDEAGNRSELVTTPEFVFPN
jgi:hypothetical protein